MTSQDRLDLDGVAYICSTVVDHGLVGVLVTKEKVQYNIAGRLHTCSPNDAEDDDHHTCCFDDSCQKLDLIITKVSQIDFNDQYILPHVMKTGEDNFTLTSKHVSFVTEELLVGEQAEDIAVKYVSEKLGGSDCMVCIGEIKVRFPHLAE